MTTQTNNFQETITVRDIPTALMVSHLKKKPAYFEGPAGLGKSMVIKSFATQLLDNAIATATSQDDINYLESLRDNNFIDIRLALETPEALNGLLVPAKNEEKGVFETQRSYDERFILDPRWVGVLLLDELPSAPPFMQNICYKLLLDREIGELQMPEGMVIAGAGNGAGHGGMSFELLKPVQNRVTAYDIDADADVWLEDFAYEAGLNPSLTSFVKSNPDIIYNGDTEANCPAFSSARSLTSISPTIDLLESGKISMKFAKISIAGDIGEVAMAKWALHHELGSKLPGTRDILDGKNPPLNPEMDHQQAHYYIAYACLSSIMTDYHNSSVFEEQILSEVNNMFKYMGEHMPLSTDIQVAMAGDVRIAFREAGKREGIALRIVSAAATPDYRQALQEYMKLRGEIAAFEREAAGK